MVWWGSHKQDRRRIHPIPLIGVQNLRLTAGNQFLYFLQLFQQCGQQFRYQCSTVPDISNPACACHISPGGGAAFVYTCSAQMLFFNKSYIFSGSSRLEGQWGTRLTRTYNNAIECFHFFVFSQSKDTKENYSLFLCPSHFGDTIQHSFVVKLHESSKARRIITWYS